jgi:hypothetical protein
VTSGCLTGGHEKSLSIGAVTCGVGHWWVHSERGTGGSTWCGVPVGPRGVGHWWVHAERDWSGGWSTACRAETRVQP